jgi:hypothetical protein
MTYLKVPALCDSSNHISLFKEKVIPNIFTMELNTSHLGGWRYDVIV